MKSGCGRKSSPAINYFYSPTNLPMPMVVSSTFCNSMNYQVQKHHPSRCYRKVCNNPRNCMIQRVHIISCIAWFLHVVSPPLKFRKIPRSLLQEKSLDTYIFSPTGGLHCMHAIACTWQLPCSISMEIVLSVLTQLTAKDRPLVSIGSKKAAIAAISAVAE